MKRITRLFIIPLLLLMAVVSGCDEESDTSITSLTGIWIQTNVFICGNGGGNVALLKFFTNGKALVENPFNSNIHEGEQRYKVKNSNITINKNTYRFTITYDDNYQRDCLTLFETIKSDSKTYEVPFYFLKYDENEI